MKAVWQQETCTAQTVIDQLAGPQEWQASTIKTLLNRLVQKGALSFRQEGRAYIYSPAVSEAECRQAATESFLERVFDGGLTPFLAHFAKSGRKLSDDEVSELEKILKQARRKS